MTFTQGMLCCASCFLTDEELPLAEMTLGRGYYARAIFLKIAFTISGSWQKKKTGEME